MMTPQSLLTIWRLELSESVHDQQAAAEAYIRRRQRVGAKEAQRDQSFGLSNVQWNKVVRIDYADRHSTSSPSTKTNTPTRPRLLDRHLPSIHSDEPDVCADDMEAKPDTAESDLLRLT